MQLNVVLCFFHTNNLDDEIRQCFTPEEVNDSTGKGLCEKIIAVLAIC